MLYSIAQEKIEEASQVAAEVAAFLASGRKIEECPPCREGWLLYAVSDGEEGVILHKCRKLPDFKAQREARTAQEAARKAKSAPVRSVEREARQLSAAGRKRMKHNVNTYQSGSPCKNGHQGLRYRRNQECVECARQRSLDAYYSKKGA